MLALLQQFHSYIGPLNLFRYLTFRTGGAIATALFFVMFFGPRIIAALRIKQGKGQPIRTDGPQSHLAKRGTPTMGGLMILSGLIVTTLLWAKLDPYVCADITCSKLLWSKAALHASLYVLIVMFVTIGFGLIGFYDDYLKVTKQSHNGLSGRARLGIETVVAAHEQFPFAQIIQPGVEVIDEHNQPGMGLVDRMKRIYSPRVQGRRLLSGEPLAITLMRGNWLYFPSICWKSDSLVAMNFREGLNVTQDLALALDLIKAGGSLVIDSTICFQYRRHRESDSSWRALEGTRFIEEREFLTAMAQEFDAVGWHRAARTARLHLSSRLHAAILLPRAWRTKQHQGVRNLREHVLARSGISKK